MKYNIVFLFLFVLTSAFSQKLTYDIFLFGKRVGQTLIEKNIKNDSVTAYTLSSVSEATVFFITRKVSLHYDIVYKLNQLISSFSKSIRNDEVHVTSIRWQGNKYNVDREDGTFAVKNAVDCSTVKLFFDEPCNLHQIFSERMGEFRVIKKTGEGTYESYMQDGITYFYRYKKGKLMELEMRKGLLGSVYLRPHI